MVKQRVTLLVVMVLILLIGPVGWAAPAAERRVTPGRWQSFTTSWNYVTALARDGQTMWVGTPVGVKRYDITSLTFRYYTTDNGLPSNYIRAITVGADGSVWFATPSGLGRYQYGAWTSYTHANSDLPFDDVQGVAAAPGGSVWLHGHDGCYGVVRFDGQTWQVFTTANSGLAHDRVTALAVDASGAVWCGTAFVEHPVYWMWRYTGAGVSRFDGTTWTTFTTVDGLPTNRIGALFADPQGGVWVKTEDIMVYTDDPSWVEARGGRCYYDGSNWSRVDDQPWPLASDTQGRLWASTWDRGIECLKDGNWELVLPNTYTRVLAMDSRGQLWLDHLDYTADFLTLYDSVALRPLPDGPVLEAAGLAADPRGGVWVGREAWIQRLDGQRWEAPESVVVAEVPNCGSTCRASIGQILVGSQGEMWIAGGGSWLFHWDGSTWDVMVAGGGPPLGLNTTDLLLDGQDLWVGREARWDINDEWDPNDDTLYGGGVSRWDGTRWMNFIPGGAGLPVLTVSALARDAQGRLWAGFAHPSEEQIEYGASYYDGATWTPMPFSAEGLGGPRCREPSGVQDVAVDSSGAVWFVGRCRILHDDGTDWHWDIFVSRYDGTNWETWYSDAIGASGHGLLVDREGRVWLYGSGLAYYENGAWHQFSTPELGSAIHQVAEDVSGRLWLTTETGKIWAYDPPREVEFVYLPLVELRDLWRGEPTFKAFPFARQTGVFTCTFEASPSQAAIDGVTGLCAGEPFSFADLAAIVRFNPNGHIDARDGGAYRAEQDIPYVAGSWYRFRLVVDVPAHRYDAFVTLPDGQTQVIGRGLAFRSEQSRVPHLDHWALWSGVGQHQVRQIQVQ